MEHPQELVILDFQHLYNFTEADHQFLTKTILDTFPDKLCPFNKEPHTITLNNLAKDGHQLIVIYPDLYRVTCRDKDGALTLRKFRSYILDEI